MSNFRVLFFSLISTSNNNSISRCRIPRLAGYSLRKLNVFIGIKKKACLFWMAALSGNPIKCLANILISTEGSLQIFSYQFRISFRDSLRSQSLPNQAIYLYSYSLVSYMYHSIVFFTQYIFFIGCSLFTCMPSCLSFQEKFAVVFKASI